MIKKILENVRSSKPLIHCITNYVTVNDCANMLLACGASPIMSEDIREVEEITTLASALEINIGTLGTNIPSIFKAAHRANTLGKPIILDPVGAGASNLRTETCNNLLNEIKFSVIRGNISEIRALALDCGETYGVDASESDKITSENIEDTIKFVKSFSDRTGAVVAITGAIDIIADSHTAYCVYNGDATMSRITGTGCQLSALIAAFVAANSSKPLKATVAAVCAMGLCGEIGKRRMTKLDGNSAYRNYIIDAMYNLSSEILVEGAKYEMR